MYRYVVQICDDTLSGYDWLYIFFQVYLEVYFVDFYHNLTKDKNPIPWNNFCKTEKSCFSQGRLDIE